MRRSETSIRSRRWLRELHAQMGLTSIFVTHDQWEALELADRVVVMDHGVIEQIGTPEEIYMAPRSTFVSDLVGQTNTVPISWSGGRELFFDRAIQVPFLRQTHEHATKPFRTQYAAACDFI